MSRIRASLSLSWKEGCLAAVMYGIVEYYLVPYGLFLGATTQEIGWLVSLPHLAASLSQLLVARLVRMAASRLRFLVCSAALQAIVLVPVALLAVWPLAGRLAWLLGCLVTFRVLNNWIVTTWGSVMSDYLTPEERGRYFGWRSQLVGVASLAGMALGGCLLSATRAHAPAQGFAAVFLMAAGSRGCSAWLLSRMADLPLELEAARAWSPRALLRAFQESQFARYLLYVASFFFAAFLAAPYFSVYLLRDLGWPYLTYMAVHLATVLAGLLAFPIWGRHADLVGNARIVKLTTASIPFLPLFWLVAQQPFYLIGVEFVSGLFWGGLMLCLTNFVYDAVSPSQRVQCLADLSMVSGLAICAGTALGAFLADRLPPLGGSRLLSLFALSALLRWLAHRTFAPRVEEPRADVLEVPTGRLVLSLLGLRRLPELRGRKPLTWMGTAL